MPYHVCTLSSEDVFRAEHLSRKQQWHPIACGSVELFPGPSDRQHQKTPPGSSEVWTVYGKHTANCCSGTDSNLTQSGKRGMYCCSSSISRWIFALVCDVVVPVLGTDAHLQSQTERNGDVARSGQGTLGQSETWTKATWERRLLLLLLHDGSSTGRSWAFFDFAEKKNLQSLGHELLFHVFLCLAGYRAFCLSRLFAWRD
jgi:hypothetical protein